jgi:hypothetical protein
MNVKILSCWFTTSYGTYTVAIRARLYPGAGRTLRFRRT